MGNGFVYPASSKSSSVAYTPVPGIVSQLQVREGTVDDGHGLDTTQEASGLGNRLVLEGEDELPSHILNSSFNDTLSSASKHTPEASHSSSPLVSVHLIEIFCLRLRLSFNIG